MKKLIYLSAAVAALFAFSSCTKESISPAPEVEGKTVNIRFSAVNAGDTKTGVTYGSGTYAPYWNKGDEIGVIFDDFTGKSNKVDAVLANANETGKTASFNAEGVSLNNNTEPGEAGKVYSFYPASAFQSGSVGDKTVRVNVKSTQTPAAVGTFDPEADILVGMPSDYFFDNSDNSFVADIPFARVMSVVKITLKAGVECPAGLAVNKLTMTAPEGTELTGRVKLSLNTISGGDSPLSDWTVKNKEVSAIYDGEKPVIGGTANTVYLIVNPTSIESGSDVIFTIDTEGYTIEKTVNLTQALSFPQGNVANIGLTIAGTNCTPKVAETRIWVESFKDVIVKEKQYQPDVTGAAGTGVVDATSYDYGTDNDTNIRFNSNGHTNTDPYLFLRANSTFTVSNIAVSEQSDLILSAQTKNAGSVTVKYKESTSEDWTEAGTWTTKAEFSGQKSIFTVSNTATSIDLSFTAGSAAVIIDDFVLDKFVDTREALATPANVTAEVDATTSNKINVSWGAVENAGSYEITLTTIGEQDVVKNATTNSISLTDLKYLTQYNVKVKAISSDVELYKDSEYSAAVEVSTGAQPAVMIYYGKVTEALTDWSGTYLIAANNSAANGIVSSSWLGFIGVTVDPQKGILSDSSTDAVAVTIAEVESGIYTIQFANGKYLGTTNSNNGIKVADNAGDDFKWKFSLEDNGNVKIESTVANGRHLRLNGDSGFRTYTNTTGIQATLYKLEESALSSIVVSGTPAKTAYSVGEAFDTDGLVATATYDNSSQKDVTNSVEWTITPETLSAGTTSVTVVAKYKGIQSNEYVVNGLSVKALSSITVKTAPTKTTYTEGEKFDPAGLVIYRNYSDDSKDEYAYADHEDEFTFDPDLATALATSNTSVTITYSGKSVNQSITVNETPALKTMDEIFAAATAAGSTAKDAKVKFDNWVVSGVNTKKNNIYVTDGTKGFIIFDSNKQSAGFAVGDILSGTVDCKVQLYNGSAELTSLTSTTDGLTVTKGGTITPATISIADLSGVNTGAVITFESLQYNGSDFSDGTNTIKPYDTFITLPSLTSGRNYSVTGVYIQYGSTKEIAPREASDFVLLTSPYLNASASKTSGIAATGETVTITVDTNIEGWTVTSDNAAFVVGAKSGNTVPVVVSENTSTTDGRTAHITVSATGVDDVVIELIQAKKSSGGTSKYVKVTSSADLTDGTYLIVCESQNVAFNGALTTLDAISNTVEVTISNNEIATSYAVNAAAFTFTASNGSFKGSGGKYFGNASNSNALTSSNTALTNTVSISDGNADVVSSGGAYLRYNKTSGQTRFRYYKSSTYTSQQAIQLYKLAN